MCQKAQGYAFRQQPVNSGQLPGPGFGGPPFACSHACWVASACSSQVVYTLNGILKIQILDRSLWALICPFQFSFECLELIE